MNKKGFTLIEVMAVISIMVLFFVSINFSITYISKLQEPSLDEFSDNIVKYINDTRYYCINNEQRAKIQKISENNKEVIRFRLYDKNVEVENYICLKVPKGINVNIGDTNNFKREITIDKNGSITPVKDIIIKSKDKERKIKVNFYSRGIYEK